MMTAAKNEELGAWNGPVEGGGRVQEHDQTPGEGVACDASEEDGKPLYGCQSLTCDRKVHTRRYVDLVPVVFPEDWFGCTRDVCAECWTVLNGGDRPIRTLKKEQSHRRKMWAGHSAIWNCWIDRALRRKYIGATREMKEDL